MVVSNLEKVLPSHGSRDVKRYYLLTVFLNGFFILPNWVFYFGRFISIPAIALIDGVSKALGVTLEIPSGAVADLLGRRKTIMAGNLVLISSCLVLINASTFTSLLVGNLLMFAAYSLMSGAREALLYDIMLDDELESKYEMVLGRVSALAVATTVLTVFVGGALYSIEPELTFWAWIVFNCCAFLVLITISEPQVSSDTRITLKEYRVRLKTGVGSLFSHSFVLYTMPVVFFATLILTYEGVVRQNTGAYFGFNGETFGYFMAAILLPTTLLSYNYGRVASYLKNNIQLVVLSLYLMGFSIVYLTDNLVFGVASFLLVYMAQEIVKPFYLTLINRNTASEHRATAISTVALIGQFPYIVVTVFFGALLEIENIAYLYAGFSLLIILYSLNLLRLRLASSVAV